MSKNFKSEGGGNVSKLVWSDIIPKTDMDLYLKAGFCKTFGYGRNPAVLIVDVEYGYVGVDPEDDILESIDKFPYSCGKDAWIAVGEIKKLTEMARKSGIPIVYVHSKRKKDAKPYKGVFGDEIVEQLRPKPEDLVIEKESYSAFFGTNLVAHLIGSAVDTLIIAGCTTSGCIRASVIDAYSYKFKVIVPFTCVFDRAVLPHKINLFDIDAKHGDVVDLNDVQKYFQNRSRQ